MAKRGSNRAYARYRKANGWPGGTDGAVRKALKGNRIFQESDGLIDFEKADAAWGAITRPMAPTAFAGKRAAEAKPITPAASRHAPADPERDANAFMTARTRREQAEAELAELKLQKAKGELISVAEARRVFFGVGKMHAAARENLPTHIAPSLIGKSDLDEIEGILRRELRARDEQISNELESRHAELFAVEPTDG